MGILDDYSDIFCMSKTIPIPSDIFSYTVRLFCSETVKKTLSARAYVRGYILSISCYQLCTSADEMSACFLVFLFLDHKYFLIKFALHMLFLLFLLWLKLFETCFFWNMVIWLWWPLHFSKISWFPTAKLGIFDHVELLYQN